MADAPGIGPHLATMSSSQQCSVCVVGAINVDLVVSAPRLPGPGETVVGPRVVRHGGGKGANAAVAAARAGAEVRLVGAVGSDDTGVAALADLVGEGVDVAGVAELAGEATGVALIVVDPAGENQIAVGAGANSAVTADHVRAASARSIPGAGAVLVSTEIPGDAVVAAVRAAVHAGVPCVLNPAPVIDDIAELIEIGPILTPNATELVDLAVLLGLAVPPGRGALEVVTAIAPRITRRSGSPMVVTLGGDGAALVSPDGSVEHLPAPAAVVRDTTGAGDTFNGVLVARLAAGEPLDMALRVALVAASLSVAQLGARDGMPRLDRIRSALATD